MDASEFLFDHAAHQIDPAPAEGKLLQRRGEVDGVQPLAFDIDEAPKTHALPSRGVGFFDGDQVPHHFDRPPNAVRQRFAAHAALGNGLGLGGQQSERRNQWKPKQFDLVERDFEVVGLKLGQGEPGDVRREEGGVGGSFLGVTKQKMRFPLKLLGVLAGEPKPAAPDDEQALLEAEPGAFDGIFQ